MTKILFTVSLILSLVLGAGNASAGAFTVTIIKGDTLEPFVVPAGKSLTVSCERSGAPDFLATISAGASASGGQPIIPSATVTCQLPIDESGNLWITQYGYYFETSPQSLIMPADGSAANLNLTLTKLDAVVTISLVNKSTQSPIIVPGDNNEKVECSRYYGGHLYSFEAPFEPGSSSINLYMFKKALYQCRVRNLSGYYVDENFTVSVPSTGQAAVTKQFTPLDATVHLRFTRNGTPFTPDQQDGEEFISCLIDTPPYYRFDFYFQLDGATSSISFKAVGGQTYQCVAAVANWLIQEFTINVPQGGEIDRDVEFIPPDVNATFNFTLDGEPFTVHSGTFWCEPTGSTLAVEGRDNISNDVTSAQVSLYGGYNYRCGLSGLTGYYQTNPFYFTPDPGSSPSNEIAFSAMEAMVQVELLDKAGLPFHSPGTIGATCSANTALWQDDQSVQMTFGAGDTSVSGAVQGGVPMSCSIGGGDQAWTDLTTTAASSGRRDVPTSGTTHFPITVIAKDSTMRFHLVNDEGQAITDLVDCSSEAYSFDYTFQVFSGTISDGVGDLKVPSDNYFYAGAYCPEEEGSTGFVISQSGQRYFVPAFDPGTKGKQASGGTRDVNVVFKRPSASVEVTVQDAQGTPMSAVSIFAVSEADAGGRSYWLFGSSDADGKFTFPVIGGTSWALQTDFVRDEETHRIVYIASERAVVAPAIGETVSRTLTPRAVTNTIHITTTSSAITGGTVYCYARNADGVIGYSTGETTLSDIKEVPISPGSWKVGCAGWGPKTGGSGDVSVHAPLQDLATVEGQSGIPITIDLIEGEQVINFLQNFDPSQDQTFSQTDVTLFLPAGSIPGSSASVNLLNNFQVLPSALGFPVNMIDLQLSGQGGGNVGAFSGDLTLFASLSSGQHLRAFRYIAAVKQWIEVNADPVSAADIENVAPRGGSSAGLRIPVTQSGIYALFTEADAVTPAPTPTVPVAVGKVKGFKVTFVNGAAKLVWRAAPNAASYDITVEKSAVNRTGKTRWKSLRRVTTQKLKATIKKLGSGSYRFSIRGVNGSSQGMVSRIKAAKN